MKNCTITIDVTGFGYTYLLQLESMMSEFLEDGNNENELDELHAWIMDNARSFADDARAAGDTLAADIFSDMADTNEDEDEELLDQAEQEEDARTGTELYADMAVQAFLDSHDARNIDAALRANGEDLSRDPNNIYRAGVFAGMAETAAWMIYNTAELDDIHAITAAIYRAYGIAY